MIQVIWVSGTACRSAVRVPGSNPARGASLVSVFSCVALCVIVMLTFIAFIIFVCFQVALRLHSGYTGWRRMVPQVALQVAVSPPLACSHWGS